MLSRIFKWKQEPQWTVTVKNGDMIRHCESTGEVQYRDCAKKVWVRLEEGVELDDIRDRLWITPEGYSVDS